MGAYDNAAHRNTRRRLIAELRDGDPCFRCHQPMYRSQAAELDAEHTTPLAIRPGAPPDALSHRSCNRRHGAQLKQLLHGHTSRGKPPAPRGEPVVTSRDW